MILMPNPRADRADCVEGPTLTEAEFAAMQNLAADDRRFLVKLGLAELDLNGFEDVLLVCGPT